MGVVHKIDQEVVAFILRQKAQSPTISCRRLVSVVEEEFHIKLSKSSINTIIKKAQLSSPVGRRSSQKQTTLQKKKKAFPRETKKTKASDGVTINIMPDQKKPPRKEDEDQSIPPDLAPQNIAPALFSINQKKEIILEKLPLCQHAGLFFLKALQWEVADGSLLGAILRDLYKGLKDIDWEEVGDILLFIKAMELNPDDVNLKTKKWEDFRLLVPIKDFHNMKIAFDLLGQRFDGKDIAFKIQTKFREYFTPLSMIKLLLEDNSEVFLDVKSYSVWEKNVQTDYICPINKVLNIISKNYINNVHSVILNSASNTEAISPSFMDFVYTFQNIKNKRIVQMSVLDTKGTEIANYEQIPSKKRSFIAAVWPWQKEFQLFLNSEKIVKIGSIRFEEIHEKIYYFREVKAQISALGNPSVELRGIILRESISQDPFVILLSNIDLSKITTEKIIVDYLTKWPNYQESRFGRISSSPDALASGLSDDFEQETTILEEDFCKQLKNLGISDIVDCVIALLRSYFCRQFLPKTCQKSEYISIIDNFFTFPGKKLETERNLIIFLQSQGQEGVNENLNYAIKNINESYIFDKFGKRLVFIYI